MFPLTKRLTGVPQTLDTFKAEAPGQLSGTLAIRWLFRICRVKRRFGIYGIQRVAIGRTCQSGGVMEFFPCGRATGLRGPQIVQHQSHSLQQQLRLGAGADAVRMLHSLR